MTSYVKLDYNIYMLRNILSFVLRILLIGTIWVFIWRIIEPRTQLMRILRLGLLVLCLLAVLVVIRFTRQ